MRARAAIIVMVGISISVAAVILLPGVSLAPATQEISALSATTPGTAALLSFIPAMMPAKGPISSDFGWRRHPILGMVRKHEGIDIAVPAGTRVVAPARGTVVATGYTSGYGRFILLRHGSTGYSSFFAHLSAFAPRLRHGQMVDRGEPLGLSGASGLATGPHLHYEIRDVRGGAVPPRVVFGQYLALSQGR